MNPSTDTRLDLALYVVATPIGNLEDLSPRAAAVLTQVALIAAEDTRRTRQLLSHLPAGASNRRLIAAHAHNEHEAASPVIDCLAAGSPCALVSDAGTPAISDPGARLVATVREAGYRVVPVPGPSAVTTLLSAAGIDAGHYGTAADRFVFEGFLPSKAAARREILQQLTVSRGTVVILEAPHRIAKTLADIANTFGVQRQIVIGRELTKRFEQIVSVPAGQALEWVNSEDNHRRGEFIIAIAPQAVRDQREHDDQLSAHSQVQISTTPAQLLSTLEQEMPLSRAVKLAKAITGLPHKALYEIALNAPNEKRKKD